jgi:hypothetical protein
MTSRVEKARIPVQAGKPIIFSEFQWARIEKAYGHELAEPVRTSMLLATEALRLVGTVEINAPALRKMIVKTKNLRDAARSLLKEIGWQEGAAWKSFEAMTKDTATVVKEIPNSHLQFLLVVNSVFAGCNLVLRDWESDGGLREGWMWDAWVQSITELMQHYGLPSTVRTDTRDVKKVNSKFVWLIKELQEHVPRELRRHEQSTDALAKAIQRARKSNWWLKLISPAIREKFAADLESPDAGVKRFAFEQKLRASPDWVEVSPGRFKRVEMVELMKRLSRDEQID